MKDDGLIAFIIDGHAVALREVLQLAIMESSFQALEDKKKMIVIEFMAADRGLECSREELQFGMDQYRKLLGFYTSAETKYWMEKNKLTISDLAIAARPRVLHAKLEAELTKEQVNTYFVENRLLFEAARLSRIIVKEEGTARELKFRLQEGADFALLAREFSSDEDTRFAYGYAGIVRRSDMSPAEAAAVFGAKEGDVIGVLKTANTYVLVRIEQLLKPELDAETEAKIRYFLVEQLLEEYEKSLKIEMTLWDRQE